ncbi:hypothetical protein [Aneurinibacillus thermoaerophilus]|uniref:hypothetical protein n=1 Tax=Aneurinibacillus thermoaerophilus TaxID=143495 RepID=UPI002E24F5E3|nr:hypothetical protein [Aneurinibacillus thermoaerophilus]
MNNSIKEGEVKGENDIVTVTLFISLVGVLLLYWTFSVALHSEPKYKSHAYLGGEESSAFRQATRVLENMAKKRMKLSQKREEKIADMLYRVGWKETPEDIVAQQVVFGGIPLVGFTLFSIFLNNYYFLILAFAVGFFMYRHPFTSLKKAVQAKQQQIQHEFPDFIDQLILLNTAGLIPYEAIKEAAKQAPESLKIDTKRLVSDMQTMPEKQALDKFAETLGLPVAKRFVFAMKQAMDMSPDEAQEIFKIQSDMMRQMRVQNTRKIIKERPSKVRMISMGVYLFIMLIPLAIIVLNFIKIFGEM